MDTFTALADPTRRSIIEMLASDGEMAVSEICKRFHSSPPAISQHLKVLRETRLVQMEKQAQQRIYSLAPEGMTEMEDWLVHTRRLWTERFDALDALLAKEKKKLQKSKHRKGRKK